MKRKKQETREGDGGFKYPSLVSLLLLLASIQFPQVHCSKRMYVFLYPYLWNFLLLFASAICLLLALEIAPVGKTTSPPSHSFTGPATPTFCLFILFVHGLISLMGQSLPEEEALRKTGTSRNVCIRISQLQCHGKGTPTLVVDQASWQSRNDDTCVVFFWVAWCYCCLASKTRLQVHADSKQRQ